ncbi:MAG: hypothetical protein Q9181_004696 [Wetmoreana brouardii]
MSSGGPEGGNGPDGATEDWKYSNLSIKKVEKLWSIVTIYMMKNNVGNFCKDKFYFHKLVAIFAIHDKVVVWIAHQLFHDKSKVHEAITAHRVYTFEICIVFAEIILSVLTTSSRRDFHSARILCQPRSISATPPQRQHVHADIYTPTRHQRANCHGPKREAPHIFCVARRRWKQENTHLIQPSLGKPYRSPNEPHVSAEDISAIFVDQGIHIQKGVHGDVILTVEILEARLAKLEETRNLAADQRLDSFNAMYWYEHKNVSDLELERHKFVLKISKSEFEIIGGDESAWEGEDKAPLLREDGGRSRSENGQEATTHKGRRLREVEKAQSR